jgi:S-(hydroxymethyl)glutathione dehydrogenase/alcohol dehydrogenase
MRTQSAILEKLGEPLGLWDIEIPALKPGQALVEIAYSGVCHTQLGEARGRRGEDAFLPHCLGHEASGVVVEVGSEIKKVAVGDQVIVSWIKGSGGDVPGTVYEGNGQKINAGGATTFARHAVISENRLTVIPEGVSLRDASYIGCAVPTGIGAVVNTAQPQPGQSLAVFGTGGVGLCAIMGAVLSGCAPIIAIDRIDAKLETAKKLGAHHAINVDSSDVTEELGRIVPKGLDFAIEATGVGTVMVQALASVRQQGGAAVVIGNARFGDLLDINPREFNMGKRILGTWGGDTVPDRDYPRYGNLLRYGRLDLSELQHDVYRLDQINDALDDLEAGRAIRPLIDMSLDLH